MKPQLVLLLTQDSSFQKMSSEVLSANGASVLVTRTIGDALQVICSRAHELDLVLIDFDNGAHGMGLLKAISSCRADLPIVAVTFSDTYHAAAVAYENHVEACLAKSMSAAEFRIVLADLGTPKPQLTVS